MRRIKRLWPLIAKDNNPDHIDWASVCVLVAYLALTGWIVAIIVMGFWMGPVGPGAAR